MTHGANLAEPPGRVKRQDGCQTTCWRARDSRDQATVDRSRSNADNRRCVKSMMDDRGRPLPAIPHCTVSPPRKQAGVTRCCRHVGRTADRGRSRPYIEHRPRLPATTGTPASYSPVTHKIVAHPVGARVGECCGRSASSLQLAWSYRHRGSEVARTVSWFCWCHVAS
jgi:hypothetical protein